MQSGERRNAENLSGTVPASARAMQLFLTKSPWNDDAVIGRLQEYPGPRLGHPEAVDLLVDLTSMGWHSPLDRRLMPRISARPFQFTGMEERKYTQI